MLKIALIVFAAIAAILIMAVIASMLCIASDMDRQDELRSIDLRSARPRRGYSSIEGRIRQSYGESENNDTDEHL